MCGVGVVRAVSLSVGSPDIEEDAYTETLESVGRNNATELIDLAIKLDHFETYPVQEIVGLHRRFADNRFANNFLRELVIANMHVFRIERGTRQHMLSVLNAKADDRVLSQTTKRLKQP